MEIIMQEITDLIVDVKNPVVMTGNFRAFCDATKERLQRINRTPVTEEEFVTAKGMIKLCESTEKKLDGAREILLAKLGDAQVILAEFQGLSEETRALRLDLNRAVTAEEDRRKKLLLAEAIKTAEEYFHATPFSLSVAESTRLKKCLFKRSDKARREALDLELGAIESNLIERFNAYEENLVFLGGYSTYLFPDAEELATRPSAEVKAEVGRRVLLREIEEKEERERVKKEERRAQAQLDADEKAKKQEDAEAGVDAFVREIRGQSEPDVNEPVPQVAWQQVKILPPPGFPGVEGEDTEDYVADFTIRVTASGPEKFEDLLDMMSKMGKVEVLDYTPINF